MIRLINLSFFYTTVLLHEQEKSNKDINYPSAEEYDKYGCTKDQETFIVELRIHAQRLVAESINSVFNDLSNTTNDMCANSFAYYGDIIDELNASLMKYRVQIHLNFDSPVIEDFMTDINFDKSCELRDPVSERTNAAYSILQEKYQNSVGLHLFVWECIIIDDQFTIDDMFEHDTCGRVMGILWMGTRKTRETIKNQIIYSLTGLRSNFNDANAFDDSVQSPLCKYVTKCLAHNVTDIGQKTRGEIYLRYDDEFRYD